MLKSRLNPSFVVGVVIAMAISACATKPPEPPPAPVEPEPVIVEQFSSLLFETNETKLSPGHRRQIRDIAAVLKQPHMAVRLVTVQGHTDATGRSSANERISLERAKAVANELIYNGIPPQNITVIGLGDAQPAAANTDSDGTDDPEGRALNRRVDILTADAAE